MGSLADRKVATTYQCTPYISVLLHLFYTNFVPKCILIEAHGFGKGYGIYTPNSQICLLLMLII